ncbi:MAG: MnhB domain-containing protein [Lachnospiraceae bacterium]|nr:MnhB domain-containing protein [Lachnospiraceae bacterium]
MSKIIGNPEDQFFNKLKRWVNGDLDPFEGKLESKHLREEEVKGRDMLDPDLLDKEQVEEVLDHVEKNLLLRSYNFMYKLGAVALCLLLISLLLLTVSYLPKFGSADNPTENEVVQRYIEDGTDEVGSVNLVSNMILGYRGFDTFGETCVLFIAATCVLVLLKRSEKEIEEEKETDWQYEPKPDMILQMVTRILVPCIFLFGIYIILNGHLSPGGGFSGGSVIGAGLILYVTTFGFHKTQKFFNEKTYEVAKVGALCLYSITMSYYFYTGANMLKNIIPLGTPGNLLSSGMILPINIFVGVEVACTMYAFFAMFRRGGM